MEAILLQKQDGHAVPCVAEIPDDLRKLVIVIHGAEQAAEEELTVENCLNSLAMVEDYLAERFGTDEEA